MEPEGFEEGSCGMVEAGEGEGAGCYDKGLSGSGERSDQVVCALYVSSVLKEIIAG